MIIDRFDNLESIEKFCKLIDTDDTSLAGLTVHGKVTQIYQAETLEEKQKLAYDLVDFINDGLRRQDYEGIVDYRGWESGQLGLMGRKIGDCPVCGRLGEISKPYEPHNFKGKTMHIVKPFFAGVQQLLTCDWGTGETEDYTNSEDIE